MQISRLSTAHMKINKVPYVSSSFSIPRVSFLLNFPSPFSIMTNNPSEIFWLKHYMLLTKRTHQCTVFQTLSAPVKVHPQFLMPFSTPQSLFSTAQCHER